MKILLASNVLPSTGGVGSHINALALGLRRLGHDVDVVSVFGTGLEFKLLPSRYILAVFPVFKLDLVLIAAYKTTQYILNQRLKKLLRSRQYDVINAQDVCAYNATYKLSKRLDIPLILTMHGYLAREGVGNRKIKSGSYAESVLLNEERRAFKNADRILVVSEEAALYVRSLVPSVDRIDVIRSPLDTALFAPSKAHGAAERKRWGIKQDVLVMLYAGRLVKIKGAIYAILALDELVRKIQKVKLLIAGDGPERNSLENAIREHGLGDSVIMLGSIPPSQMPSLYNMADVVVIPSVSEEGGNEGTPMVALEAMACGVPIVASRVGGLAELIGHSENGLLVPERDPLALAEAIMYLAENRNLRDHIIEKALAQVRERHSDIAVATQFERLYDQKIKHNVV